MNIFETALISPSIDKWWKPLTHAETPSKPIKVLVLALMEDETTEKQFLQTILNACKIADSDLQWIKEIEVSTLSWIHLKRTYSPQYVLLFGIHPTQLKIEAQFAFNAPNRFDQAIFIPTLSAKELQNNIEVKKQLWIEALKPQFL